MKNINRLIFGQLFLVIVLVILTSTNIHATIFSLDLALSGQKEVPANPSSATGILIGTYDAATNFLSINLMFNGLQGTTTAAHFHGPATEGVNGPVQIPLTGFPAGVTSGAYANTFILTHEQESQLLCGMWYINIHTSVYPGGEIRSQLKEGTASGDVLSLEVAVTGLKEVNPTPSPATGILIGTYNIATNVLSFDVMFNGLLGTTTAAHFHGPATSAQNAGVQIALVGFPVGVTSGAYSNSFVLTPQQETQLLSGLWYLNIHTTAFPGGEIRGQITEGTLTGNCGVSVVPVANWAILLSISLIGAFTFFLIRRSL